jgi:hypothetical protein
LTASDAAAEGIWRRRFWSVAAGAGIAAFYTVAPLAACAAGSAALAFPLVARGLPRTEQRWLNAIVIAAVAIHLMAIGGQFLRNLPAHDDLFVGAPSGDEAYTMSRALRTRDILLGAPTTLYDFFVAFDEYGRNSYVTAATALQVMFGPTPYSLRLLNTLIFVAGALVLFRLARSAFGPLPAFGGLTCVLFWPSLFAWSISLLKESLYFLLGASLLAGAVAIVRHRSWISCGLGLTVAASAACLMQDLRPGALPLAATGLATGLGAHLVLALAPARRATVLAAGAALLAIAFLQPSIQDRVVRSLEAAAKVHTGHVFTVGHDYKLLDEGFYVNPAAPAASSLTLTGAEAARYAIRATASFVTVPLPWQLRSSRELAYLPEQLAWYVLVVLLPIGFVAGYRRDSLVTCMLAGYVAPTALALALTNGNVGTLLRLRGLVVPYLAWIALAGACAALGTLVQRNPMNWIDKEGRLFGRVNVFDAALAGFAIALIPIAYGTFLLFRMPSPRLTSVTQVPVTREELRVAGGNRLTAKLKVRGSGLRPMLQAGIGTTRALGFVFEDPNSADVLVGEVPPGTHDFVLYDGVQEVARLARAVTIETVAPGRVAGIGTLIHLDRATAESLTPGRLGPGGPEDAIVKLGAAHAEADSRWQRDAEILLQCDPDPEADGCAVSGQSLVTTPLPIVTVKGPSGALIRFALREVLPAKAPEMMNVRVRIAAAPEVLALVRPGDRDDCLDDRAASVVDVGARRPGGAEADATIRLGVDPSPTGWRYRGAAIKAGAPVSFATERFVWTGTVLTVGLERPGGTK